MKTFYRLIVTYETFEFYNELTHRDVEKFPIRKTLAEAEADGADIEEGREEDEETNDTYYTYKTIEELEVPID